MATKIVTDPLDLPTDSFFRQTHQFIYSFCGTAWHDPLPSSPRPLQRHRPRLEGTWNVPKGCRSYKDTVRRDGFAVSPFNVRRHKIDLISDLTIFTDRLELPSLTLGADLRKHTPSRITGRAFLLPLSQQSPSLEAKQDPAPTPPNAYTLHRS